MCIMIVSVLNKYRFFLLSFPQQYSITTIYIAFSIKSNLEMIRSICEHVHRFYSYPTPFNMRDKHPHILVWGARCLRTNPPWIPREDCIFFREISFHVLCHFRIGSFFFIIWLVHTFWVLGAIEWELNVSNTVLSLFVFMFSKTQLCLAGVQDWKPI